MRTECPERQHLGRADSRLAAEHRDDSLHNGRAEFRAAAEQRGHFLEQLRHNGRFCRRPGNRDLISPDVDIGVEGTFDHVEQLVAGSKEADHGVVIGDHDLDLSAAADRLVGGGPALAAAPGLTGSVRQFLVSAWRGHPPAHR